MKKIISISLFLTCLALTAPAQTNTVLTLSPIAPTVQDPLAAFLASKSSWLPHILMYIGLIKMLMHYAQGPLQDYLTSLSAAGVSAPGSDLDQARKSLLNSKAYRLCAEVVALLASVKLPSTDTHSDQVVTNVETKAAASSAVTPAKVAGV